MVSVLHPVTKSNCYLMSLTSICRSLWSSQNKLFFWWLCVLNEICDNFSLFHVVLAAHSVKRSWESFLVKLKPEQNNCEHWEKDNSEEQTSLFLAWFLLQRLPEDLEKVIPELERLTHCFHEGTIAFWHQVI